MCYSIKGFYRVNYDDLTWKHIGAVLKKSHKDIHVLNRAQVRNKQQYQLEIVYIVCS